jgi:hypothetical protein
MRGWWDKALSLSLSLSIYIYIYIYIYNRYETIQNHQKTVICTTTLRAEAVFDELSGFFCVKQTQL